MFGGSMFAAMDPPAMVALIHLLGEDYVVWNKSASIQYKRPANQHAYAQFRFEENELAHIRQQVDECGECIHSMAIPWTSADGQIVFSVVNKELYIASKVHHRQKRARQKQKSPTAVAIGLLGDPVGIRTPNLRIRSAMLYPVELQGPSFLTSRSIGGQR